MRRAEREITGINNILKILDKCEVLRLGLSQNNQSYIVPMNFAFELLEDEIFVYLHCALEGKKIDIIKQNNKVCFEADCSHKLAPGKVPCAWTMNYESVMGEGEISIVQNNCEKISGMDLMMARYGYKGKPNYPKQMLDKLCVLRITVTQISGKANL